MKKRRKRGGARSRLKKVIASQRVARQEAREERKAKECAAGAPGLFAFINT